jgi:NAD(P)-dependent dehydrogenase (short-subunit alcohol dehydrogenase family)
MPLVGAYCASKFALEAAADAPRMELAPWHIPVIVVQPHRHVAHRRRPGRADRGHDGNVVIYTPITLSA